MTDNKKVADLRPRQVDLYLYGTNAWSVVMTAPALGTLVGATVVAKHRATGAGSSITLTSVIINAAACSWSIGWSTPIAGEYDVEITLAGGLARTYVWGDTVVMADRA